MVNVPTLNQPFIPNVGAAMDKGAQYKSMTMQNKLAEAAALRQANLPGLVQAMQGGTATPEQSANLMAFHPQTAAAITNNLANASKRETEQIGQLLLTAKSQKDPLAFIEQNHGGLFDESDLSRIRSDPAAAIDWGITRALGTSGAQTQQNTDRAFEYGVENDDRNFDQRERNNRATLGQGAERLRIARENARRAAAKDSMGKIPDGYRLSNGRLVPMQGPGGSPFKAPPNVKDEGALRKEFTALTKDFRDIDASYQRMQSAAADGPGDIALLIGYMKMLDPGSVVREGEFATAQNAGGVDSWVRGVYNKAIGDGFVSAKVRAQINDQATAFHAAAKDTYMRQRDQYSGIASQYGFDPDRIVPSGAPKPQGQPKSPTSSNARPVITLPPAPTPPQGPMSTPAPGFRGAAGMSPAGRQQGIGAAIANGQPIPEGTTAQADGKTYTVINGQWVETQ